MPRSCTSLGINILALINFIISLFLLRYYDFKVYDSSIIIILILTASIILPELIFLKTYKRDSTGLDFSLNNKSRDLYRIRGRLITLYLTFLLIGMFYWLIPEYNNAFYKKFIDTLKYLSPFITLGAIPYFYWIDAYLLNKNDIYFEISNVLLNKKKFSELDRKQVKNYILGWSVKAFFLPLMFTYLQGNISYIFESSADTVFLSFMSFYDYMYNFLFTIDLLFVSVGYIFTFRVFDTHIRSVEPSFFGWAIALICYRPFWDILNNSYLAYEDGYYWGNWLRNSELLTMIWGLLILFLLSVYVWATIAFGARFSNLTNRGIITNGPYRFSKHPAYLSKNIAWWLISVPFISTIDSITAFKHCCLLLIVNLIYYFRAKTEEKHLLSDTDYMDYYKYINKEGLLAKLKLKYVYLKSARI